MYEICVIMVYTMYVHYNCHKEQCSTCIPTFIIVATHNAHEQYIEHP